MAKKEVKMLSFFRRVKNKSSLSPRCLISINFIANVLTFIGLCLTVLSTTIPVWFNEINNHMMPDKINFIAALLTVMTWLLSQWCQKQLTQIAKKKEMHTELLIQNAHAKIEKYKAKAEEYRSETERIKQHVSWRDISAKDIANLCLMLKDEGVHVGLAYLKSDPEALRFANILKGVFESSGVLTGIIELGQPMYNGLVITGKNIEEVSKIMKCFSIIGLNVEFRDSVVHFGNNPVIHVGSKSNEIIF
ncbi:hypothetical protein [Enterobacter ludwigii]|uniref:hypothetical protein n=1 Tax=Enterobacter ludwigii TaxID=299767 RepID=UPI00278B6B6C|nr:hypothetical protein [Enterobacter ludwigii]MDP9944356.1 hypothetical protein [Enterobacter ludwigii]MDR6398611.1 hypothetical protein [Enterobacter ludwigii]